MDFANASNTTSRRKVIKAMIARAQGLDLCFLLDATSSMQGSMDMVKNTVADMARGVKAAYPLSHLRVSLVLYRDYDDRYQDTNNEHACAFTTDYTDSSSTFRKFLSSVRASGGGDTAEDVFTGLQRVAELDWQATSRLLVHICDAPCHGTRFHDLDVSEGVRDSYPQGDKFGRDIADLLQQLRGQCKITRYFFCHLTEHTTKMIREFKKVIGDSDWIKDARFEDINIIPQEVIAVSRSTITETISTLAAGLNIEAPWSVTRTTQFSPETVIDSRPNWEEIPEFEGHLYKFKWLDSLEELLTRIKNKEPIELEKMDSLVVKIAPNPFSGEGATRRPYHALVLHPNSRFVVVKRFKIRSGQSIELVHSKERYLSQMEVQAVATRMANDFNERTQSLGHQSFKKLEFIAVSILYAGFQIYNMEEYLEGAWIRYSNNAGYVNTEEYAASLQAFTHWTYERSGGQLMVTDLQGVAQRTSVSGCYMFWLCDPAIHCKDLTRFAGTNLGEEGFKLFFHSHKCGDLCRLLHLESRSDNTIEGS